MRRRRPPGEVALRADDPGERRVPQRRAGELRLVERGGQVANVVEARGAGVGGARHPDAPRSRVHQRVEASERSTSAVERERGRRVVCGHHQRRAQQRHAAIPAAGDEPFAVVLDADCSRSHGDACAQMALLDGQKTGHHLRQRGDRPTLRLAPGEEHVAGPRVDDDEGLGRYPRKRVLAVVAAAGRRREQPDDGRDRERCDERTRVSERALRKGVVVHRTRSDFSSEDPIPPGASRNQTRYVFEPDSSGHGRRTGSKSPDQPA